VVPSQALIGMPDDVPGCNIQQAFFVVAVDGSLDTAVVIQEIGNEPQAGRSARIHWHMRTVRSQHVADQRELYTRNDVVPLSVRDLINANVSPDGLALLLDETTFPFPVYIGYITWENDIYTATGVRWYANNLIAKMYVHNMPAGQATMVNLAAREYMPTVIPNWLTGVPPAPVAVPWLPAQGSAQTITSAMDEVFAEYGTSETIGAAAPRMENFTPNALAASMQRERGYTTFPPGVYPPIGLATGFALYPRFYLYNETAQDYILIWKSINARLATDTWRIEVNIYDTAENAVSGFITIPNELNVLSVRDFVPPSHIATYPAAGWVSISIPDIFGGIPAAPIAGTSAVPAEQAFSGVAGVEFLGYNLQLADSAAGNLNWAALTPIARDVNFATR
jgi:hypothetical protein